LLITGAYYRRSSAIDQRFCGPCMSYWRFAFHTHTHTHTHARRRKHASRVCHCSVASLISSRNLISHALVYIIQSS